MNQVVADLHLHTTASDGRFSPEVLCEILKINKIKYFSITDHDTTRSIETGSIYAKKNGMLNIPGVEYSTFNNNKQIHIVGYLKDYEHAAEVLEVRKRDRILRANKMVDLLNQNSIAIDFEDVLMEAADADALGRPHIARALLKAGFIKEIKEAFEKYIGDNKPCYVPKMIFSVEETVKMIHSYKGIAIVAYPYENDGVSDLDLMLACGIDGVEVYTPKNKSGNIEYLTEFAKRNGLLITGGSDYHGDNEYQKYGLNEEMFNVFYDRWRKQ